MHHVNVRIDELEDKLQVGFSRNRTEEGGKIGGTGSRTGSFIGGDDGGGGGWGGGGGGNGPGSGTVNFSQFNHFMNTQNKQLGMVQQEINEIRQLMRQLLKARTSSLIAPTQSSHLPDSDSSKQPYLLGAGPRVSSMESRQQEQQEQPFLAQGHNFFETKQHDDAQNQHSDSRSTSPFNYLLSDPMRSQSREPDDHQDPSSSYPLPRVEYTAEADC